MKILQKRMGQGRTFLIAHFVPEGLGIDLPVSEQPEYAF
jgi:hypothetical protein